MKLILEKSIKSLLELEITPIVLLYQKGKSIVLNIHTDKIPVLTVNYNNGLTIDFPLDKKETAQKFFDSLYFVPKEISDDNLKLKELILNMQLDCHYYFEDYGYKNFEVCSDRLGYSWSMTRKSFGYVYPLKGNMAQRFKTEVGARKSLINYLNL
jgi:hypothetical protein